MGAAPETRSFTGHKLKQDMSWRRRTNEAGRQMACG